ncbi:MAG: M48 family metalloprotease [Candidatus Accumulibacter sp.]|nr:M48 family metalloprotease [Accumulibacter sp.]
MDQRQYYLLIKRLEVDAAVSPGAYRAKVLLISSAAYAVLFGMLLAIALLIYLGVREAYMEQRTSALVRIGLVGLVMAPAFFVVLRMFFIRLAPPEGRYLVRAEAPALFGVLDKMRKRLNGPPIHHVLIDDDFNAAISQRPRWGLFGGHTNYLILGLPYMLGVSPEEMLATVAHEYGHVCGNHGKISAWVYRQRLTFGALHEQVEHSAVNNWMLMVMARMLRTFMPYYDAYTFVLSRQNEYEADRTATDLVGGKFNAQGLIRGMLLGRWIDEEFWPKLYKQADDRGKPAFLPFNAMRSAFKASYPEWAGKERLDAVYSERSGLHDTHPALRDRLEGIGHAAALPAHVEKTAADALLGVTAKALIGEFDRHWWEREKASWTTRHQYATRSKARLRELSRLPPEELKAQDLQERALLSAEFESPQTAKALLEQLLQQPGGPFPKAAYHYGCILLAEDVERGLDYLSTAAGADRQMREAVARAGYVYLFKKHGGERAQEWWDEIIYREEVEA